MTRRDDAEAALLEATLGAHRERDAEGLPSAPPQWWDLSPEACERACLRQAEARLIESALDERGWSGTVKAVLERV
jgi:hypothetical protein